VKDLTAYVLAGGKSTRMGRDKAFLPWGNGTLLSHAVKLAGTVAANVSIVGEAQKFAPFGSVVEDVYRERGPLGGIHAALSSTTTELNLMLAVDLPLIEAQLLEYLVSRARQSGAMITVPRARGGYHPLCAVYRREFGEFAEKSLREKKNKIDSLFTTARTCVIEEKEMEHAGFSAGMFGNVNTPEELEKARSAHHRR